MPFDASHTLTTPSQLPVTSRVPSGLHATSGTRSTWPKSVANSAPEVASQILTRASTNDAYSWTGYATGSTATVPNGLNQVATKLLVVGRPSRRYRG